MTPQERKPLLERVVYFDIENLRHQDGHALWCCGFRWLKDGTVHQVQVDSRTPDAVERLENHLARIKQAGRRLATFNGLSYDLVWLVAFLNDPTQDARELSDRIINPPRPDGMTDLEYKEHKARTKREAAKMVKAAFPDHIDLTNRNRQDGDGAVIKGLKLAAAILGYDDVQEHTGLNEAIDDAGWEQVLAYNLADLKATEFIFRKYLNSFEALEHLGDEVGLDLVGEADADAAELYFLKRFQDATGTRPDYVRNFPRTVSFVLDDVKPFTSPEAQAWRDYVGSTEFPYDAEAKGLDTKAQEYKSAVRKINVGGLVISVGWGGCHSVHLESGVFVTDDTQEVVNSDVESYYPNLILNNRIQIGTTGSIGLDIYRDVLTRRLATKARCKDLTLTADERRAAKTADSGFKVVVNSLFGKTDSKYSRLNSPGSLATCTLAGQLYLVHLVEAIQAAGGRVIQVNTDGVVYSRPRDRKEAIEAALEAWQLELGLKLETEVYQALALNDANNYLSLKDGQFHGRGNLRSYSNGSHQQQFPPVVNIAVLRSLVERIPPEKVIRQCDDIRQFLFIDYNRQKYNLETPNGTTRLGKVLRLYASVPWSNQRLTCEGSHGANHPRNAGLALKIPAGIPGDLDYEHYAGLAREKLEAFKVPFDPDQLTGHARTLWDLGMVPAPASGKVTAKGTRIKGNAISCVDWPSYRTLKVFTGPTPGNVQDRPGIVAIDIDDAERFAALFGPDIVGVKELAPLTVFRTGTAEDVQTGQGRGKLLFILNNPDHRFGDNVRAATRQQWLEKFGFEIFFGTGTVATLGKGPGGTEYKLAGTLGEMPAWFESVIIKAIGRGSRNKDGTKKTAKRKDFTPDDDPDGDGPGGGGLPDDFHEQKPDWKAVLDDLGRVDERFGTVESWIEDNRRDGRHVCYMECPANHGEPNPREAELFLDNESGLPVYRCFHTACDLAQTVDDHFRPIVRFKPQPPRVSPQVPTLETTPISDILLASDGLVLLKSPTGTGKSYGTAIAAGILARRGELSVIVVPSRALVRQVHREFLRLNPDLMDRVAVHRELFNSKLEVESEDVASIDDDDDKEAAKVVEEQVLVRIVCHEALGRRDFSREARNLWCKILTSRKINIFVDEFDELVEKGLQFQVPFAVRTVDRGSDHARQWFPKVITNCPASLVEASRASSGCEDCVLRNHSHVFRSNFTYGTNELATPQFNWRPNRGDDVHLANGYETGLNLDDFECGPELTVHDNSTARMVTGYRGVKISHDTRQALVRNPYAGDFKEDSQEGPGTIPLVMEHIIHHLLFPQIKTHFPVDATSKVPLTPEDVITGYHKSVRKDAIQFPVRTCQTPYLVGLDSMFLEMLRETAERGGRVVMMSATLGLLTEAAVQEVFGDAVKRVELDGAVRPIDAVTVITVANDVAPVRLSQVQGDWLDKLKGDQDRPSPGKWLIATPSIRSKALVNSTLEKSQANYADAKGSGAEFRHTTSHETVEGSLASIRQPISRGYNGVELALVLADYDCTRLAVDFLVPEPRSQADFERFQREELDSAIIQLFGRPLRGESSKRVALVLANSTEGNARRLVDKGLIHERAGSVQFIHYRTFSEGVFDDIRRWLDQGGEFQVLTPEIEQAASKHERRVLERKAGRQDVVTAKLSKLLDQARNWKDSGGNKREFMRKHNINRQEKETPGIMKQLEMIFGE